MYLIYKALHLISVTSWLAGMLYLPRLFVYHADVSPNSDAYNIFKVMEYRLLKFIINPAMISSFIFGILIMYEMNFYYLEENWFRIKILAVFGMIFAHIKLSFYQKKFALGTNNKSAKFFRIMNEVPTILMIIIIFMVVCKPSLQYK